MKKELLLFQKDDGRPYVLSLPEDPRQLPECYSREAFASEGPCQCQVDVSKLAFIQSLVPERMPKDLTLRSFGNPAADVMNLTALTRSRFNDSGSGLRNLQLFPPRQRGLSLTQGSASHALAASGDLLPVESGPDKAASNLQLALPSSATASSATAPPMNREAPVPEKDVTTAVASNVEPDLSKKDLREDVGPSLEKTAPADLQDHVEEKPNDQNEKSQFERVTEELRQKLDDKAAAKQRPAAAMKRPVCKDPPRSQQTAPSKNVKKKAPEPKKKAATKAKPMKKPSLSGCGKRKKSFDDGRPPDALKLYPDGCGKCRYKPGCCPSCYRARGEW